MPGLILKRNGRISDNTIARTISHSMAGLSNHTHFADVNLKEKKVVTFATIEQTCPPVSTEQTCPVTQQSDVPLSDTAPTEQSSTSSSKSNQSSSKVRTRVSPSTAPVLSSQSSNPGSDSLSSSDLAIPTLTGRTCLSVQDVL